MQLGALLVGLGVCGVLAGCGGDNCTYDGSSRCENNAVVTCQRPGGRDLRTSNYFDRETCRAGLVCVEKNLKAGCAIDAVPCDKTTFQPTITKLAHGIEILDCDLWIGGETYRVTKFATTCDPATFKPSCIDSQSLTTCAPHRALETRYPALRGLNFEGFRHCLPCAPTLPDFGCKLPTQGP